MGGLGGLVGGLLGVGDPGAGNLTGDVGADVVFVT